MSLSPSSLFLLKPLAMKPVPSPPIDCRFRVYGCHTRLSREAMEQHMVTATNVHLHLLLSKLTDLERSSRSLDRRVTEMEIRGRKHTSTSWHTTTIPSMMMMSDIQNESIKELSLHAIPSVPSYASMTSLSSAASEDDSIKTDVDSRKRRREEEDELDSDDDDESQGSPAYGAHVHVHESLIQVASMAQSIPPTWSTGRSSRSDRPVTAAALRRRAARRLKRQRALLEGPGVPKKPKTAYNYFQSESRKQIQQEVVRAGPHLSREERSQQVARVIGERWKALTEEQRIPYQILADQDKERYREACEQQNMEPESGDVDTSESPISTASMSSGSPISPHSPVSPILSGSSAFHRASPSSVA